MKSIPILLISRKLTLSNIHLFSQINKLQAYKILGVNEKNSWEDIKSSYLKLSKKYHPDLNPDKSTESSFKEINEAYSIIRNFHNSSEIESPSFSIKKTKYNKYDGKLSKEDFDVFKKYKNEKMQKDAFESQSMKQIENEWDKNEEEIFFEIFGRKYKEAPEIFWDEKNQNLREIYEEEMDKLFKKKFSEQLQSVETKFKEKINEYKINNPPKSKDKASIQKRILNIFKK